MATQYSKHFFNRLGNSVASFVRKCVRCLPAFIRRTFHSPISISIEHDALNSIRDVLLSLQQDCGPGASGVVARHSADPEPIEAIRRETAAANRNNVTRTAAYLALYKLHPELHWALLAHLVSRNGGYSMTDLQGGLLPWLLSEEARESHFLFLETANALIFQDAYPQLLLYRESMKCRTSLFHQLPLLHVSAFMRPFWEMFWNDRTRYADPLAIALIVNEQHYIEDRVVRNDYFRRHVFNSAVFEAQSLLRFDQIIMPYGSEPSLALSGTTLGDFTKLYDRIEAGKQLYAILFGNPGLRDRCMRFAERSPHSGSRADYWPEQFSAVRTKEKSAAAGTPLHIYSPVLAQAWPDRMPVTPERFDWYKDPSVLRYFERVAAPRNPDMTKKHKHAFVKTRIAAEANSWLR